MTSLLCVTEAMSDRKKQGGEKKIDKSKPVKVPVPKGCKPGQKIKLSVYGQKVSAFIPDDAEEGTCFKIMPPKEKDDEPEHAKQNVTVTVPHGVKTGEMLTFTVGEGSRAKKLTVLIPNGIKGGDEMTMTMYSDYDKPSKRKGEKGDKK